MLPWLLCLALALLLLLLLLKLHLLRRGMREIAGQVSARLSEDSNNPIFLSSRDRALRQLAAELNAQLRQLRPEAAQRHIAAIRNRARAMKHLTEELLHYSVILSTQEELALEPLSLNGALEESLASFYAALTQAGITPQVQLPEAPVVRMLNGVALARVFGYILSNALKYSAGDLAVTLSEIGEACFSNAGPGLIVVQVGKFFDRFFTVEAARSSSGLGLSIAKTLVEHMGGQISAEYADGVLCIRLRFEE